MERIYLNNGWSFMKVFEKCLLEADFNVDILEKVRIPHTNQELTYHYFDEKEYQGVCGYRKDFKANEAWREKAVHLTFEGAAHEAQVYINGHKVIVHQGGYTAFTVDITAYLNFKGTNSLVIRLDTRESLNIPPFGHVVDYLTYGGIYREVYLEVKNKVHIEDIFVMTEKVLEKEKTLKLQVALNKWEEELYVISQIKSCTTGKKIEFGTTLLENQEQTLAYKVTDVALWDIENPNLYVLETKLFKGIHLLDTYTVKFGFREAKFMQDGFYLNDKKVKLRGLNRHQSYPYVGYAMPKMPQINDANILKNELGVNAVRTSHYPQSHDFINRCDELGLLVFTEMPGWQHIGDSSWQEVACENVREMVQQYRNHPSIVLWGVRINESRDDEAFYKKTNEIAHQLDPSRQTGGVRCHTKSQLLEDVYTYNDFVHEGHNKALSKKRSVTSHTKAPYLVSEYNGHMYPTKAFDAQAHRLEHALRHARVLDTLYEETDIAGGFGWCMFDYNTHQDFGSGDRICYHGVMDMFRNPKMATYVYAAQQDETSVLEISSSMNIGEQPGGILGEIYAFTNAESIRVYKNNVFMKEYLCEDTTFKHMPHGPICIDDWIGSQLESAERYSKGKSEGIKKVLLAGAKYGMSHLPLKEKLRALKLMICNGMTFKEGLELYNKYIGNWGEEVVSYRFEAIKDGKVVRTVTRAPMTKVRLEVDVDHNALVEDTTYDVASVRIRAVDEHGNVLNFYGEAICLETVGEISLIGPSHTSLKGGMGGTYVKTTGKCGSGKLKISGNDFETVVVPFTVQLNNQKGSR